ncbi:hypothetical protein NDU88_000412 [Pleurodeles waltl]|uniref:Uncharacterized protein n=1 Tax=Pleurodeles waltl TaxID=8319 RepID=A0AAV7R471_PLEWA|nr:hypothetical protein NDU88_000400 [Pleurodeles waltl]KAJ1147552.1 hypothetical protein NDU88_000412 [Pleurodeles waltl]
MGARVLAYRDVVFNDTRQEHQGPHDGRSCPRIQRRGTSRWALVSSHTETCCSLTQDMSTRDLTMGARVLAYRDVLFNDTRQEHMGPHDGRSCPRIQRRAVH